MTDAAADATTQALLRRFETLPEACAHYARSLRVFMVQEQELRRAQSEVDALAQRCDDLLRRDDGADLVDTLHRERATHARCIATLSAATQELEGRYRMVHQYALALEAELLRVGGVAAALVEHHAHAATSTSGGGCCALASSR